MKKFICSIIILLLANINIGVYASTALAPAKKQVTVYSVPKSSSNIIQNVSPLNIVNNPSLYLNKKVTFSGEFVSFTSLGLDYKPAFRDSSKYIGVLMKRPDVTSNTIPLSELKMFMTREMAEKNIDIDTGDKFTITGVVFSTALGDPWLDITDFRITTKKVKSELEK